MKNKFEKTLKFIETNKYFCLQTTLFSKNKEFYVVPVIIKTKCLQIQMIKKPHNLQL